MRPALSARPGACLGVLILLAFMLWCASAQAAPKDLGGRWFELIGSSGPGVPARQAVARLAPTGGSFEYDADFKIDTAGSYVIDFKNSSVIGRFEHRLFDASGALIAQTRGGIQNHESNPFFLRHGRDFHLEPGPYRLVTRVDSPFFLAQPEPYLDTLDHYRQAIKPGNAVVLLCLGVFIGLGVYYASLALARRRAADGLYALFILGNLLYNATALQVTSDLFDLHGFYLISVPILFSNIAYVAFVIALLQIDKTTAPRTFQTGRALIGLLGVFVLVAAVKPHWSLELDRIGVALFLMFGLGAGIRCVLAGDKLARFYLMANIGFFVSGFAAISLFDLQGVYASYIEHLGLVAVTIEVLLLALVLSYQFGQLQQVSVEALARAQHNLNLALTDSLTGLRNRYALDLALRDLPAKGSLTFVDLDGLKHYNDRFGHAHGDKLLQAFSTEFSSRLGELATLHRLGGDEFAVVCEQGDIDSVECRLTETVEALQQSGYDILGASHGSVRHGESADSDSLKHLADARMYEHKRRRRVRDVSA